MTVQEFTLIFVIWNTIGSLIVAFIGAWWADAPWRNTCCGFLNPYLVHKQCSVNWFGAVFLTFIFNLICPVFSLCYWVYILCTVGRS